MSVAAATSWRVRNPTLYVAVWVTACVLVMQVVTFSSMASIWARDATFAHGFAIPLISLWLLWQRRTGLAAVPLVPARAGWVCCGGLTVVWLLATLTEVQVVAQAAATALLPAALWAVLGTQFVRRAAFPLAYLAFAVPWGDVFVPTLMRFTTEFTVAAVRLVGVPIFRDGNLFSLPSGNFEVIKACSGVRYLIASLALGVLYAGISYRSWRRRAAFIALSIVVPIIANGLRAFGIVMIAHSSQMKYAVGVDHLIYGWLFFGLVMALLFWIGNRFAEPVDAPNAAPVVVTAPPASKIPVRGIVWLALLLCIAPLVELTLFWGGGAGGIVQKRSFASILIANELPAATTQWRGPTQLQDEWRPSFARDDEALSARYDSANGRVLVFVHDYVLDEAETGLSSRALVAEELAPWRVTRTDDVTLSDARRVRSVQVVGPAGAQFEVWMWRLVNDEPADELLQTMWLQLRSWLRWRTPVSTLVVVAVPGIERAQARRVLNDFLAQYPRLLGTSQGTAP